MTSRTIRFALLGAMALYGLVAGYFAARQAPPPRIAEFFALLAPTPLAYAWYFLDARERGFRRSVPLGSAVVLVAPLALPYYLVKSRPRGSRAGAIGRYVGFVVLVVLVPGLVAIPVALLCGSL
jgi:hypothetical protein